VAAYGVWPVSSAALDQTTCISTAQFCCGTERTRWQMPAAALPVPGLAEAGLVPRRAFPSAGTPRTHSMRSTSLSCSCSRSLARSGRRRSLESQSCSVNGSIVEDTCESEVDGPANFGGSGDDYDLVNLSPNSGALLGVITLSSHAQRANGAAAVTPLRSPSSNRLRVRRSAGAVASVPPVS
jgi:hypothetical protein